MKYHILHRSADILTNKWMWITRTHNDKWCFPTNDRNYELIIVSEHTITDEQLTFLTLAGTYVETITAEHVTDATVLLLEEWT